MFFIMCFRDIQFNNKMKAISAACAAILYLQQNAMLCGRISAGMEWGSYLTDLAYKGCCVGNNITKASPMSMPNCLLSLSMGRIEQNYMQLWSFHCWFSRNVVSVLHVVCPAIVYWSDHTSCRLRLAVIIYAMMQFARLAHKLCEQ